jgi:hypothetical protein
MLRQVLPRVKSRCKSAKRAVEKNSPSRASTVRERGRERSRASTVRERGRERSRASTVRERDQRRPHTHTAVRSNHAAADDIACTDQCTSAPQRKEDGSPPPMPMHVGVFIQADVIDLATVLSGLREKCRYTFCLPAGKASPPSTTTSTNQTSRPAPTVSHRTLVWVLAAAAQTASAERTRSIEHGVLQRMTM